ncbi:hypothetical protein ACFSJY_06675 [Thalassotalea euphylliae]|uniref:hypothetical protein n=1 Tax=Thalassotalea euphylliae TaxID=1655234 RepID=UPI00363500FC
MRIDKIIALCGLVISFQVMSAPFGNAPGATEKTAKVETQVTTILLQPKKISDSSGLVYVGGYVQESSLTSYLSQMDNTLGKEFVIYRAGQQKRDHNQFHITLVNPFEFKALTSEQQTQLLANKKSIKVNLLGLGSVKSDNGRAFFVVAESEQGQQLRNSLDLADKDFHVTLGFSPSDIHGVKKDKSTLLNK